MHRQISLRLKIILSIIALVVITGLSFAALYVLLPRTPATGQATQTSSTPKIENAAALLAAYEKSTDITGRGAASYTKRTTTSTNTSIFYFNKAKPYNTTLSSSTLVQYQAVDVKQTTNSKELVQTTTKFLQSLDLAIINTRSTTGTTATLFEGPTVICQTDDIHIASYLPVTYGLVCIDKALVDSTYQQYNTLINLAKADVSPDSIT